jgi:hypothetical protein
MPAKPRLSTWSIPPNRVTAGITLLTHEKPNDSLQANDNSRWHAAPTHLHFVIGKDHEGYWLVVETHGRRGGFFISREAALKYPEFETDHRPGAVECTTRPVAFRN